MKKQCVGYHKNNCWESWSWGRADIKYDVKQDRVVFLIKNRLSHKIVGAVGRGLNKNDILNGLCMVIKMFHLNVVIVMMQLL